MPLVSFLAEAFWFYVFLADTFERKTMSTNHSNHLQLWIIKNLFELTGVRPVETQLDPALMQIKSHSLKMVTFLARFNREFGRCPRILDFINDPSLRTLTHSIESAPIRAEG